MGPAQALIHKVSTKDCSPEEIGKEIDRISFDPLSILIRYPDDPGVSILYAAMGRNMRLRKFLITKFPQLLTVQEKEEGLPLTILLKGILCNIYCPDKPEMLREDMELLEWCVSSFPKYNNATTTDWEETPFYLFFVGILRQYHLSEKERLFLEVSYIRVCRILIAHGAVIKPSILPSFILGEKEIRPEWGKNVRKKILLHLPDVLVHIVITYSQDLWELLMPQEDNFKDSLPSSYSDFKRRQWKWGKEMLEKCFFEDEPVERIAAIKEPSKKRKRNNR